VKKKTPAPPANPVTQEARDCFALFVKKWQELLGLRDWRIEPSSKPAGKANMAEINKFHTADRLCTYTVGTDFGGTPVTDMSIEEIACHEVWHVRLHRLIEICRDQSSTQEEIDEAEHAVIHVAVALCVPIAEPTFEKKS
jgi:hypothetical protein